MLQISGVAIQPVGTKRFPPPVKVGPGFEDVRATERERRRESEQ